MRKAHLASFFMLGFGNFMFGIFLGFFVTVFTVFGIEKVFELERSGEKEACHHKGGPDNGADRNIDKLR